MMLLGAVLAGGRSRRFGSDKALADLDGRPLIEHAVLALRNIVDSVVICGRESPIAGVPSIADWPAPDLGPLGGLCGALRHAAGSGHAAVISIGCDTPILPTGLLAKLGAAEGAAFVSGLPIFGRWPVELADSLTHRLLHMEDRSVRRFAAAIGAAAIEAGQDIPNLNRPDDLARLRSPHNA